VLGQVGAYVGNWSVLPVATGKQGVGASFRLEPINHGFGVSF